MTSLQNLILLYSLDIRRLGCHISFPFFLIVFYSVAVRFKFEASELNLHSRVNLLIDTRPLDHHSPITKINCFNCSYKCFSCWWALSLAGYSKPIAVSKAKDTRFLYFNASMFFFPSCTLKMSLDKLIFTQY